MSTNDSKEQQLQQRRNHSRQHNNEAVPVMDKKLKGPNRPAE